MFETQSHNNNEENAIIIRNIPLDLILTPDKTYKDTIIVEEEDYIDITSTKKKTYEYRKIGKTTISFMGVKMTQKFMYFKTEICSVIEFSHMDRFYIESKTDLMILQGQFIVTQYKNINTGIVNYRTNFITEMEKTRENLLCFQKKIFPLIIYRRSIHQNNLAETMDLRDKYNSLFPITDHLNNYSLSICEYLKEYINDQSKKRIIQYGFERELDENCKHIPQTQLVLQLDNEKLLIELLDDHSNLYTKIHNEKQITHDNDTHYDFTIPDEPIFHFINKGVLQENIQLYSQLHPLYLYRSYEFRHCIRSIRELLLMDINREYKVEIHDRLLRLINILSIDQIIRLRKQYLRICERDRMPTSKKIIAQIIQEVLQLNKISYTEEQYALFLPFEHITELHYYHTVLEAILLLKQQNQHCVDGKSDKMLADQYLVCYNTLDSYYKEKKFLEEIIEKTPRNYRI